MRATLGVGVHLAIGGVLAMLALVSPKAIVVTVVGGLSSLAVFEWRRRRAVLQSWKRAALIAWQAPLFAIVLFAMLAACAVQYVDSATPYSAEYNVNDDGVAYFEFARQMLGSGTLIEPFSLRRMASFGGQTYLQASTLVFPAVSVSQIHLVDRGLFVLIAGALILGLLRERPSTGRVAVLVALAVLIAFPNTRINTSSQLSGGALLFGLHRLISGRYLPFDSDLKKAAMVGLAAMAVCTLRQSYILPVGLLLAFHYGGRIIASPLSDLTRILRDGAYVAAGLFIFLLPWMILSYRSHATFLFPLIKGNYHPEFGLLQHPTSKIVQWQFLLKNAFYDFPVKSFGLFILAGAVVVDRRPGRPLQALLAACAVGAVLLVRSFQLTDPQNLGRYYFALEVAVVLAVTLDVVGRASQRGRGALRATMPATLAMVAAGLFLLDAKSTLAANYDHWVGAFERFDDPPRPVADADDPKYHDIQQTVPPGERLLVMIDQPFRLDFARNRIINFDLPSAASPAPGVPLFDGPEAVASYFDKLSIRYIAFMTDTSGFGLYNRSTWEKFLKDTPGTLYQLQARFFLAAFSDLSELARTRKHLAEEGNIIVLDLKTRSAPL